MSNLFFAVVAVVAAFVHLLFSSQWRATSKAIAATYLIYLLFLDVGVMGIFTAYGKFFVRCRPLLPSAGPPAPRNTKLAWPTSPSAFWACCASGFAEISDWRPR